MLLMQTTGNFMEQIPVGLYVYFCLLLILPPLLIGGLRYRRHLAKKNDEGTGGEKSKREGSQLGNLFGGGKNKAESAAPAAKSDIDMLLEMTGDDPPPKPKATSSPAAARPPDAIRQPGIVTVRDAVGKNVEAAEMLIILRSRSSDKLLVQIGDHVYDGTEPNIDGEFRKRFVEIMRELSAIAPTLSKGAKASKPRQPPPKPTPSESKADAVAELLGTGNAPSAADDSEPTDLAGQIELLLQRKLANMPELRQRDIHVSSAPGGGVRIKVDSEYFESVGEISDKQVRTLIASTIEEWQATQ